MTLPLKNDVNVVSKSNKQINLVSLGRSLKKILGSGVVSISGSFSQRDRSAVPDPYQNVIDPQHCPKGWLVKLG